MLTPNTYVDHEIEERSEHKCESAWWRFGGAAAAFPRNAQPIRTFPNPAPLSKLELQAIADLWADRLEFDPLVAQHADADWYRKRIGRDCINAADAAEVRRRTMRLCQDVQDRRRLKLVPPPKPEQDVRALIGKPEIDVHAFTAKSAEGARLFAALPREDTGCDDLGHHDYDTRDYFDSAEHQRRRFTLLWLTTLIAAFLLAMLLP